MTTLADTTTFSYQFVFWPFLILGVIFLLWAVGSTVAAIKDPYSDWAVAAVVALLLGIVTLGITIAASYPLKYDYHHWVDKSGIVQRVETRGFTGLYVVVIDGVAYRIDDTRASLLEKGDKVHIKCKKEYEWGTPQSSNGWGCKWVSSNVTRTVSMSVEGPIDETTLADFNRKYDK